MDDVMIVLGALIFAVAVGAVYLPAGGIALGALLVLGGVLLARRSGSAE